MALVAQGLELATAFVGLSVSARGLRKDVDAALGGAVDESGKKQGSKLGGLLWGGVKRTGVAAAAGIGVATGAALFKGFGRLSGIENAEAKLRGLGHSAETVTGVMDNALGSVKGTAFGLDEAATTAAGAVAAGIKPGKELERTLGLTADTATIAGTSMGEMGSIFNKVATGNRLSMEEVNQLGDRGIPIMQMLADQYGVTALEAREMVSNGEVDFANFQKAIEDNIAGAALESGNTTEGAFKNMGAALGRVGASLLGGIFPKLKGGFGGITDFLDNMGPIAEKAGNMLGSAIQWAADTVGGFVAEFKAGEGAGGRFRDIMTGIKDAVMAAFNFVRDTALPVVQNFIAEFRNGEGAGGHFRTVLEGLKVAVMAAFDYVRDTAIPALMSLGTWIKDNKTWLGALVGAVVGGTIAWKAFTVATNLLSAAKVAWAARTKIVTIAQRALNAVMRANPVGILITALGALVGALIWLYNNNETARRIMNKAWDGIKSAMSAVVDWFRNVAWPWMRDAMTWIGDKATWLWKNVISPAFSGIKSAVSATVSWVRDTAWPWMKSAFQNIGDAAGTLKDRAKTAWDGIAGAVSGAWDKAKNIFDKFKSGLSSLRDRFRSIKDGIVNIWGSIARGIGKPINSAIGFFNKFLSGLESTINKIPGVDISLPRISEIPLPAAVRAGGGGGGGGASPVFAAAGGMIPGFSPNATADNIPAMLTAGEFVLPVKATDRLRRLLGAGGLESLRRGLPGFASGGEVGGRTGGGLGDVWDALKGIGSGIAGFISDPIGFLKDAASGLLSAVGDSWPGQILQGVGGDMIGKLANWVKEKFFGADDASGPVSGGMPWQQIWGIIKMLNPMAIMTSNKRGGGSKTASGYTSYHGLGRAVDWVTPGMGAAAARTASVMPWTEHYYTPWGFMRQGRMVSRDQVAQVTQDNHWDHIHTAYGQGGLVKPLLFDQGGYLPKGTSVVRNNTGRPEPLKRMDGGDGPQEIYGELRLSGDGRAYIVGQLQSAPREMHNLVATAHHNSSKYGGSL